MFLATKILELGTKSENVGASWTLGFFLKVDHCLNIRTAIDLKKETEGLKNAVSYTTECCLLN